MILNETAVESRPKLQLWGQLWGRTDAKLTKSSDTMEKSFQKGLKLNFGYTFFSFKMLQRILEMVCQPRVIPDGERLLYAGLFRQCDPFKQYWDWILAPFNSYVPSDEHSDTLRHRHAKRKLVCEDAHQNLAHRFSLPVHL